jgi:hypothetical protein
MSCTARIMYSGTWLTLQYGLFCSILGRYENIQNLVCLMYFFNVFSLKCYEIWGPVPSAVDLHLVVFGCVMLLERSDWTPDGEIGGSDGRDGDSSYVVGCALYHWVRGAWHSSHIDLRKLGSLLTENTVPHPERHEPLLFCIYPHARQLKSKTTPKNKLLI